MPFLVTDLDADFVANLEQLIAASQSALDAMLLIAQREWYTPPSNGWGGDPLDIVGLNQAFQRPTLNSLYVDVVSSTTQQGRIGEAMFLKIQLDYIAALERAYRTRQATSIRSKMHAASRRRGQAASGGLFNTGDGNIAIWLTRMLDAAHYDPPGA